jgi:hypothetical protein
MLMENHKRFKMNRIPHAITHISIEFFTHIINPVKSRLFSHT